MVSQRRVGIPLGGRAYEQTYHTGAPSVKHIPIHGGIAIYTKTGSAQEIGTLGCIVWDKVDPNKRFILSNQHVLYPNSANPRAKIDDPVYQVGDPSIPIGKLYSTIAESNPWPSTDKEAVNKVGTYHDSALAIPTVEVSDEINGIGKLTGMIDPVVGMNIRYNGRTSGLQRGKVTHINKTVLLNVGNGKTAIQKNIFYIDAKSANGDSGSLIVNDDNKAIGLLFASNEGGGTSCCLVSVIASKYNISFVKPTGGASPSPDDQVTTQTEIPAFVYEKNFMLGAGIVLAGLVVMVVAAGQGADKFG